MILEDAETSEKNFLDSLNISHREKRQAVWQYDLYNHDSYLC